MKVSMTLQHFDLLAIIEEFKEFGYEEIVKAEKIGGMWLVRAVRYA